MSETVAVADPVFSDPLLPAPVIYRDLLRVSRPTFYRLAQEADFPRPVVLGERSRRWRRSEILAWVAARTESTAA